MPKKYVSYSLLGSIEDIWEYTIDFWSKNSGKIIEKHISSNSLYRSLKIATKSRMRMYAFSFGETYEFSFGYDIENATTLVSIMYKFSPFAGRGFIYKLPQETMDNWALGLKLIPIKFEDKKSQAFIDVQSNQMEFIKIPDESVYKNCKYCGAKCNLFAKRCLECSNNI